MLSPLHQALLGEVMFPQDSGEEIAKSIVTEQCLGASDGSVIDNTLASFAVKLCSSSSLKLDDNPNEFSAIGAVDGVSGHISSLRAESRGAISILLLLHIISMKWKHLFSPKTKIYLFFDSLQ
jgi:hypothetical protein